MTGMSCDWPSFRPYAVSLSRSGFKGVKVVFGEGISGKTKGNIERLGFEILDVETPQQAADTFSREDRKKIDRFLAPAELLARRGFRHAMFVDSRDVVFQSDPTLWLENNLKDKELVLAGLGHAAAGCPFNDPWVRYAAQDDELWRNVRSQEALCSGVLAGTSDALQDLLRDIHGGVLYNRSATDQGMLNCLARTSPYKEISMVPGIDEPFVAQWWPERRDNLAQFNVSALHSPDLDPVFDEHAGEVRTWDGKLYSTVHLYDRSPKWAKIIKEKYGN
jgi:hypothetical protein